MKVLITDGLCEKGQEILKEAGIDFLIKHYEPEELIREIPAYDCVLVRSATKVPAEVIDAGKNLKVIARGGAGIDNIDHEYAKTKGIPTLNTPAANSASVAELAIAHMFRPLPAFSTDLISPCPTVNGKRKNIKVSNLAEKTLGIIGCGKIGQLTAEKALGLGMKVIAADPVVCESKLDIQFLSMDEVFAKADIISLHVPKMKEPLIGKRDRKDEGRSLYHQLRTRRRCG
ncbi:MAG: NAD(P)-dependent oxidoreductase [Candidatus Marinimicrobia bacterium]|nr:NAD(P)-dependent oxidoreductase [Candidatus Neomarinimicrobiota bacterium]